MADTRLVVLSCLHAVLVAVILEVLYSVFSGFAFLYSTSAHLILYVFTVFFTYDISKRCFCGGEIKTDNKAVFITGCDSGFGHETTKSLDSRGFRVFATCLFPEGPGATKLKKICSDNLQVLHMDVTKDESVEKALNFVKQNLGNSELWAIVNNAGILEGTLAEFTHVDAFRRVMEVNAIGQVRVAKAFLPLLRKSKGRIVNVNSLAGRASSSFLCAYTMSKHASVAFTECLSQEMNVWGVRVISIEPEGFRTPLSDLENAVPRLDKELKNINDEIFTSYGEDFVKKVKEFMLDTSSKYVSPKTQIVVDAITSAIMDKYPNYVYKSHANLFNRMMMYLFEIMPYCLLEYMLYRITRKALPTPEELRKSI